MKDIASSEKTIIIGYIQKHEYATANDKVLAELLGNCSSRKVLRLLNYLADVEGILHKEVSSRPYKYILKDKAYIVDALSQKEATDLHYALEFSSEEFSQDSIKLIKRIFKSNSDAIDGHLSSFEDLKDTKLAQRYNELLDIIKHRYYAKLTFKPSTVYNDAKCVKMLFLDNNWYVAFEYTNNVDKQKRFRLGRLLFIKSIELLKDYKYSNKNSFQKKDIAQYIDYIENIQNSLTLYGVEPKIVKITALQEVSQYFLEDMKKFLRSQKFIKRLDDGSVEFSVEYTQPLEILPFIQRWIPYLVVEEGEIREMLNKNLERMIKAMQ